MITKERLHAYRDLAKAAAENLEVPVPLHVELLELVQEIERLKKEIGSEPSAVISETTVPFRDAQIPGRKVMLHAAEIYTLQDGRRIEVWRVKGDESRCIRIFRPTDDGKVSCLDFGLNEDAALALLMALNVSFEKHGVTGAVRFAPGALEFVPLARYRELETQLNDMKRYAAIKDETATTFMNQLNRLQNAVFSVCGHLPGVSQEEQLAQLKEWLGSDGVRLIGDERLRHVTGEGWTAEHDDEHAKGQLAFAATCYAKVAAHQALTGEKEYGITNGWWPWDEEWWKPSDDLIRNLSKAGALIAAEIDRLKRKESRADKPEALAGGDACPTRKIKVGDRIRILPNLPDVLDELGFDKSLMSRLVNTEQTACSVWKDEGTGHEYVTVDLCVEIPIQCCELLEVKP